MLAVSAPQSPILRLADGGWWLAKGRSVASEHSNTEGVNTILRLVIILIISIVLYLK